MRVPALLPTLATLLALSVAPAATAASAAPATSRFLLPPTQIDGIAVAELSGLAWDADEQLLYAVSDQSFAYHFRVRRDDAQGLALEPVFAAALTGAATTPGDHRRFNAEGLALRNGANGVRGDSELVVALEEKPPEIARFSPAGKLLGTLPVPSPANDMAAYRKKGRGLEAVAFLPPYGLVTAPEAPLRASPQDQHAIYAAGHAWQFPRQDGDSRLKGIEVLPDGSLLVLERTRPAGPDQQVATLRRLNPATCGDGKPCSATLVASLPPGPANFEGMTLLDAHHVLLASDNGTDPAAAALFVLITLP